MSTSPASEAANTRLWLAAFGAIAIGYLLQIASPIRLDTDSVRYLAMAIGLADNTSAVPDGFPSGYPLIVAGLDRMGLGSAHAIIAWNCLFLAISMLVVWWMTDDRPRTVRLWTVLLTIMSLQLIRTVAMPHPESTFLAVSLTAIAAMNRMTGVFSTRNINLLIASLVLTGIALTIRIAAVALIPPMLWCVLQMIRSAVGTGRKQRMLAVGGSALLLFVVALALAVSEHGTLSRYLAEGLVELTRRSPVAFLIKRAEFTFRGAGELVTNAPVRQMLWLKSTVTLIGLVSIVVFARGISRMQFSGTIRVYLLTYMAILVAWPFFDPRLWMPILPLLVLGMVTLVHSSPRSPRVQLAVAAWAFLYIGFGAAALAYTTRISWSGENFRSRYGFNGGLAAVGHHDPIHDSYARMIIKRFDSANPAWRTLQAEAKTNPEAPR
jgi:hypothetical protein